MSSGVKVNKDCNAEFDNMKMKKHYNYVVFKLTDNLKEIVVDQCGDKEKTYDDLRQVLLEAAEQKQCRYAVYDLHFMFKGQPKQKLIFIAWNPENASTKQKMIYTSSKDYIKKALDMTLEAQATDCDEISLDSLTERAQRGMKD